MMNFDVQYQKADQAIEKIKSLISAEYIEENITAPLDYITFKFHQREDVEYSHKNFHKTIAEFIQRVSEKTTLYGCKLTLEKAHAEAVSLLNNFYRAFYDTGIDGAIDDATNPNTDGMALVISNFNESLKNYAQLKHIDMVKYRYIDSVGWQMRYIMTKLLLAKSDIHLIGPMDKWSTEQLSGCLFELIQDSLKG